MTNNRNIIGNTGNAVGKILITCPHNGTHRPDKLRIRDKSNLPSGCNKAQFNTENDKHTRILATKIANRMHKISGKSPGLVIAGYDRKYIDMNRSRDCAYEVQEAKQFYDEYHQLISDHVEDICIKNKNSYIRGWLFDIHGRAPDEETPEEIVIGTENGKTIARLKK
jgi:N-formylglutamate amidohydrolase